MEKTIYLVNFIDMDCGFVSTICIYDTKEEAEKAAEYGNETDALCSGYRRGLSWYEVVPITLYQKFDESKFKKEYENVMPGDFQIKEEENNYE